MNKLTPKNVLSIIACSFIAAFLFSACSLTKGKEQGEHAVEQFHQQFNAGQYSEIYQQSDDKFKEAVKENEIVELLAAVQRKLGKVNSAQATSWNVSVTPMGTVVTLTYETQFGEGKGFEQFAFLVSGEKATLLRYDVNSPLLITR